MTEIVPSSLTDVQQAADRSIAWFHVPSPGAVAQLGGVDSALVPDEVRPGAQVVTGHALAALASRRPVQLHERLRRRDVAVRRARQLTC